MFGDEEVEQESHHYEPEEEEPQAPEIPQVVSITAFSQSKLRAQGAVQLP